MGVQEGLKEGLFGGTEAAMGLTGPSAFYATNNKKEVTLQKPFEWPKIKTGRVARSAGLWSQLCHSFAFAQHQAFHTVACCHSTPSCKTVIGV